MLGKDSPNHHTGVVSAYSEDLHDIWVSQYASGHEGKFQLIEFILDLRRPVELGILLEERREGLDLF